MCSSIGGSSEATVELRRRDKSAIERLECKKWCVGVRNEGMQVVQWCKEIVYLDLVEGWGEAGCTNHLTIHYCRSVSLIR